jgi:hypothetical protein
VHRLHEWELWIHVLFTAELRLYRHILKERCMKQLTSIVLFKHLAFHLRGPKMMIKLGDYLCPYFFGKTKAHINTNRSNHCLQSL